MSRSVRAAPRTAVTRLGTLGLALMLSACYAWVPQHQDVYTVLARQSRKSIRVDLRDGRAVEILDPWYDGDYVIGTQRKPAAYQALHELRTFQEIGVTVAVADICAVKVRRFSAWRTSVAVVGMAAPAAYVIFATTPFFIRRSDHPLTVGGR